MHNISKNKITSSSLTLAREKDDIRKMHQEEGFPMNIGTETDLSEVNQNEARCNEEKPQETPIKNFL